MCADTLWRPASGASTEAFSRVLDAIRALESEVGDVVLGNMPSDEVLLGNVLSQLPEKSLSPVARQFRLAYLRWRLPLIKSCEGPCAWSQTPEVEHKD